MNRPDLLLTRDDLEVMKNNQMFTLWAFGADGTFDNHELTEEDLLVIKARQMYYDLLLPDDFLCRVMCQVGCMNIDEALSDARIVYVAAKRLNVSPEIVTVKLRLIQMRIEHENKKAEKNAILGLTQEGIY